MHLVRLFIVVLCFTNSLQVLAKGKCSKIELKNFNCDISAYGYELNISQENIRINDGVRRNISKFPMPEFSSWKSVEFKKMGNRNFVELKIWSKGATAANVESLHWVWLELIRDKSKLQLNHVIQKRRPRVDDPKRKIYDPQLSHVTKPLNSGKIQWSAGRFKGVF